MGKSKEKQDPAAETPKVEAVAPAEKTVRTPSDESLTSKEAAQRFSDGKLFLSWAANAEQIEKEFLGRMPVTPAAHTWLKAEKKAFDPKLHSMLVRRAENTGSQLKLAETKKMALEDLPAVLQREKEEREELYDPSTDSGVPKDLLDEEGKVVCSACVTKFRPQSWNAVRDGEIVKTRDGKTARRGNFVAVGSSPVPICRKCYGLFREKAPEGTDVRQLTYEHASRIISAIERAGEREDAVQRLAEQAHKRPPRIFMGSPRDWRPGGRHHQ